MNKRGKIIIAIVLVLLVIIIGMFTFSEKENSQNKVMENEKQNVNTGEENIIINNEIENENIVNEVVEDNEEENMIVNTAKPSTNYQSKDVYESNPDIGSTDKKQEAINLVKSTWGEDDSVTFSCDSITSDGEYIIAVTDNQAAIVRNYFRVNLQNQTVTVEY